jgi:glycine hydroxymethyltransferase
VDLGPTGLTGKEAEEALDRAGITVNKNAIPFDTRPPTVTSGIRVGAPALTTRGMKEKEMEFIADLMHQALSAPKDEARLANLQDQVRDLTRNYPLFAEEWVS